jgi:hypothetical protein
VGQRLLSQNGLGFIRTCDPCRHQLASCTSRQLHVAHGGAVWFASGLISAADRLFSFTEGPLENMAVR